MGEWIGLDTLEAEALDVRRISAMKRVLQRLTPDQSETFLVDVAGHLFDLAHSSDPEGQYEATDPTGEL